LKAKGYTLIIMKKNSRGFSLIEILIFTSIFSLFFITVAGVVSISLMNMKINEHKIIATRYAQQAIEWLTAEKEDDWVVFTNRDTQGDSNPTTYCIGSLNWTQQRSCINPDDLFGTPGIYIREMEITDILADPVTQVNVTVTVSWQEAGGLTYSVPVNSVLSVWEQ